MIYSDLIFDYCPFCGTKVKTKYFCHNCQKSFQILTEFGSIDPDLISEIKWNDSITTYQKKIILEILSECVKIEGGSFTMGDERIELKNNKGRYCPHRVSLSSFYISKFLVTQRQWFAFMPPHKCNHIGDEYPVDSISWHNCIEFTNELKRLSGINFGLPTEAQWLFVAKECDDYNAKIYSGSNILEKCAWTKETSTTSHRPGLKMPNKLGIYDMTGNLFEICLDRSGLWDKSPLVNPYRCIEDGGNIIRKGGSWKMDRCYIEEIPDMYNINSRDSRSDDAKMDDNGFRLAIYDESILTEIK